MLSTPGEVEHTVPDDSEAEIQPVPLDFMGNDLLTRSLLREELKHFASTTLYAEFSRMRSLLQEDIQDALLRVEVSEKCAINGKSPANGTNVRHPHAPPKVTWAARRSRPASICSTENRASLASLRSAGDSSASGSSGSSGAAGTSRLGSKVSILSRASVMSKASVMSRASEMTNNSAHSTKFLLKGNDVLRYPHQNPRGSTFSNSQRRKAKTFGPSTSPDALGQKTKFNIARCCEIFLEHIVAVIIVLNGIFIGVQADYQARNLTEAVPAIFPSVEIACGMIFLMELVVRMYMFGKQFFVGPGWRWNWFDAILVVTQLIEVAGMIFTDHESSSATPVANVSFLRLLHILRLLRVLRLVRLVEFVGELKAIISSISNSMRSLCWTLFLLLLMIYIVGILFTQAVFSKRVLMNDSDPFKEELAQWWGSLDRSILSLYQAILGGVDWGDMTGPLSSHVSPILTLLFCFYIAFTVLAMMNVITGIFVESAIKNAEKEKDIEFSETAHAVFALADIDESGQITWQQFVSRIDEPQFQWYMKNFGIDPADAKLLFKLLDHNQYGVLDLEDLVSGMIRLRAGAKFMDVMKIMHEIERTTSSLKSHEKANAVNRVEALG